MMIDYSDFKVLVDLPAEYPGLGFQETAKGLGDLILRSEPRFSIAIFGPWGSGKTTLMNAIRRQLDDHDQIIKVEFSAWRYEREEHLIVPLLDTIRAALVDWANAMRPADAKEDATTAAKCFKAGLLAAETIGKVIASVLAGLSFKLGVPGALDLSYDANKALEAARRHGGVPNQIPEKKGFWEKVFSKEPKPDRFSKRLFDPNLPQSFYHACFSALEETFKRFADDTDHARIIIFVDDLDRCLPAGTLDVLESMKLFFDLKGFVFVVGLDREVVEKSIDSRYLLENGSAEPVEAKHSHNPPRLIKGADYLKKIFQVPFSLAPVSYSMLDDLFSAIQKGAGLSDAQERDMRDTVLPHLTHLFSGMRLNPREVKRYINAYTIQMKVKPNLDEPHIVLALNTLAFRQDCRNLYDAILTFRVELTSALQTFLTEDATALEDFDLKAADVPDDIREYLGDNGVAHALLASAHIDAYLDAGEAARSSAGGYFLELLSVYRDFRSAALQAFKADDPKSFDGRWSNLHSIFYKLKELISQFRRRDEPSIVVTELEKWLDPSHAGNRWNHWLDLMNRRQEVQPEQIEQAKGLGLEEAKQHLKSLRMELRKLRWHSQLEAA
jgi:hypothetical protein